MRQVQDDTFAGDVARVSRIGAVTKILEVVCRVTGMGFAAVARVTEERWVACAVRDQIGFGLEPGGELEIKTTICDEIRQSAQLVAIDDVEKDDHYCGHATPRQYGFRSYISVPILRRDGQFFGTLCAIDPNPAQVNTPEAIGMFTLFAELIGFHLDAEDEISASARALADERQRAALRDQFIAVLGHDLRNPLAAIQTGGTLLGTMPLQDGAARAAAIIQSSAARMAGLIGNLLDFARGQLGGGFPLKAEAVDDLAETIDQVISELRAGWPGRVIDIELSLERPVVCDRARIEQLLSNLVANALNHGASTAPVRVRASSNADGFELDVANFGDPIPPELLDRLFQPFVRSRGRTGQQGLGLGLYIASEIARAHGGTLDVSSGGSETRFVFRIPPPALVSTPAVLPTAIAIPETPPAQGPPGVKVPSGKK